MKVNVKRVKSFTEKHVIFEINSCHIKRDISVEIVIQNGEVKKVDMPKINACSSVSWRISKAITNEIEKILDEVNGNDK